jgi:hypothetical protein
VAVSKFIANPASQTISIKVYLAQENAEEIKQESKQKP